jgi:endoglucanase
MNKSQNGKNSYLIFAVGALAVVSAATSAMMLNAPITAAAPFNYGEALQKSIYFYEAQQAGKLPAWNRVKWRGDSVLMDGADVGINLSGGWYDAGDHVKFGFPMASSATMLAWGVVDYRTGYAGSGQLDEMLNNLRFVNDYFIAAHPSPNVLYGQVGQGNADHAFWGPPEVVELKTSASRIAYKIDLSCKGPDLASETAAAMAASSIAFKPTDPTYATTLQTHAKQLYALAIATLGTNGVENNYSNCITDAKNFYNGGFGVYWDEMAWGALWLWRATNDPFYLQKFQEYYPKMGAETGTTTPVFTWAQGWNDKAYGTYALAAILLGDQRYHDDAQRWLDHWVKPSTQGGGAKTPAGLIVVDRFNGWGTNRYAANTAFIALYYGDKLPSTNPKAATYKQFGERQINYILGDNPRNSSYMVGFGSNPPLNVHHRGSHGSWANNIGLPAQQRHVLYGALVGGPASTSDTDYADDRGDFKRNEVATDYNSGLTSALARMVAVHGGTPIPDALFPPAEAPTEEFVVGAKVNATGTGFIELRAVLQNKSTTPAQVRNDLRLRYFVNLTELYAAGFTASNVAVTAPFNQGSGITQLQPWGDPSKRIFYTEAAFDGVSIYPGGLTEFRREVQFRMTVPAAAASVWNNGNDPSWDPAYNGATGEFGFSAIKIPIYAKNGVKLAGTEPVGTTCGGSTGVNCLPVATDSNVTTTAGTAVQVNLAGTDSDGTIASRTVVTAPVSGTLSGTGATRTYTPNAGFTGNDRFTFTVTDNNGGVSAPATVNITVNTVPPANRNPTACFNVITATPRAGTPVEFDGACSTDPDNDPLSYAWTFGDGASGTGPQVARTYAAAGSYSVRLVVNDGRGGSNALSKTITVAPATGGGGGTCIYSIDNQWNSGFVAKIVIRNTGTAPINGWTVGWSFADGSKVTSIWNATLTGTGPYSASALSWNSQINPGQSAEFGFQASKGVLNGPAPTATVTGSVCQ